MSSTILACQGGTDRIISVDDPHDPAYSTKDDVRDLPLQGNARVRNTYKKLTYLSPANAFKALQCSVRYKGRLQKLIFIYLTDLAQRVDAELIYSVGSHYTNVSTQ